MSVLAGAKAPEHVSISITNAEAASEPLDLETVTAVSLVIVTPAGARKTWAATIETQLADMLVVDHVFDASGNDIADPGEYRIEIMMTVPDGIRRAGPTRLLVTNV